MATKIRLARYGARKNPFYRIVVADSESPRDGRFIEILGTYNPLAEPAAIDLKQSRVQYWLEQGARPTDTVRSIIKKQASAAKEEQPQA